MYITFFGKPKTSTATPVNLVTIDLKRAEQSVSSLPGEKPKEYIPKTLTSHNSGRKHYLPLFRTEVSTSIDPFLLANVPGL